MIENITIAFSGFNIKDFAILAMESFLLQYPEMRNNIIYFDDNSTDGSVEAIRDNGIKVITWTDYWENKYLKYKRDLLRNSTQEASARVCFIMREIMEQTHTKYLLINDGDVVFLEGGFIEKYMEQFRAGSKIVFREEKSVYPKTSSIRDGEACPEVYEYYKKYETDIKPNNNRLMQEEIEGGVCCAPRAHMLHIAIDLDYLKSIDMLGDRLNEHTFILMNGGLVDTGTDFYHRIKENNTPCSYISNEELFKTILHWGWLSSSNRISMNNHNLRRDFLEELKRKLNRPRMKLILSRLNIDYRKMIESYMENKI